jgi:hypothetical protein
LLLCFAFSSLVGIVAEVEVEVEVEVKVVVEIEVEVAVGKVNNTVTGGVTAAVR